MTNTNCKADHYKGNDWESAVSAALSSSFGGAVLGGHLYNMTGALIGGLVGILVEIWSFKRSQNPQNQNETL